MGRFSDKHILITGGTSGIGLAGARRIIAEGGSVTVTGTNAERLDAALSTPTSAASWTTTPAPPSKPTSWAGWR
jgi:NAD(P)-dependent dehydrogenase (short-subunit alcohol dehydrogenase family)